MSSVERSGPGDGSDLVHKLAAWVVPAGRGAPGLVAPEPVDSADVERAAGAVVRDRAVGGVGRVVGPDRGDDHAVVGADGVEGGVEPRVEGPGADVGALERGEGDLRVVEDLRDR